MADLRGVGEGISAFVESFQRQRQLGAARQNAANTLQLQRQRLMTQKERLELQKRGLALRKETEKRQAVAQKQARFDSQFTIITDLLNAKDADPDMVASQVEMFLNKTLAPEKIGSDGKPVDTKAIKEQVKFIVKGLRSKNEKTVALTKTVIAGLKGTNQDERDALVELLKNDPTAAAKMAGKIFERRRQKAAGEKLAQIPIGMDQEKLARIMELVAPEASVEQKKLFMSARAAPGIEKKRQADIKRTRGQALLEENRLFSYQLTDKNKKVTTGTLFANELRSFVEKARKAGSTINVFPAGKVAEGGGLGLLTPRDASALEKGRYKGIDAIRVLNEMFKNIGLGGRSIAGLPRRISASVGNFVAQTIGKSAGNETAFFIQDIFGGPNVTLKTLGAWEPQIRAFAAASIEIATGEEGAKKSESEQKVAARFTTLDTNTASLQKIIGALPAIAKLHILRTNRLKYQLDGTLNFDFPSDKFLDIKNKKAFNKHFATLRKLFPLPKLAKGVTREDAPGFTDTDINDVLFQLHAQKFQLETLGRR